MRVISVLSTSEPETASAVTLVSVFVRDVSAKAVTVAAITIITAVATNAVFSF